MVCRKHFKTPGLDVFRIEYTGNTHIMSVCIMEIYPCRICKTLPKNVKGVMRLILMKCKGGGGVRTYTIWTGNFLFQLTTLPTTSPDPLPSNCISSCLACHWRYNCSDKKHWFWLFTIGTALKSELLTSEQVSHHVTK